nr:MAG TPA: hypothetical protein [Crassvirales sp.]
MLIISNCFNSRYNIILLSSRIIITIIISCFPRSI